MRRPRPRPKHRLAFVVVFSGVVGGMVLALVSMNALLAQASFRIDDLSNRIAALRAEHLDLVSERARLSAPGRVAAWARRDGMVLPEASDLRYLHPRGAAPAMPGDVRGGA